MATVIVQLRQPFHSTSHLDHDAVMELSEQLMPAPNLPVITSYHTVNTAVVPSEQY